MSIDCICWVYCFWFVRITTDCFDFNWYDWLWLMMMDVDSFELIPIGLHRIYILLCLVAYSKWFPMTSIDVSVWSVMLVELHRFDGGWFMWLSCYLVFVISIDLIDRYWIHIQLNDVWLMLKWLKWPWRISFIWVDLY